MQVIAAGIEMSSILTYRQKQLAILSAMLVQLFHADIHYL